MKVEIGALTDKTLEVGDRVNEKSFLPDHQGFTAPRIGDSYRKYRRVPISYHCGVTSPASISMFEEEISQPKILRTTFIGRGLSICTETYDQYSKRDLNTNLQGDNDRLI